MELPDGATEADTERNGVLSYAGEWHALLLGIGAGLVVAMTGRWEFAALVVAVALGVQAAPTPRLRELTSEPWCAIGGLLIGMVIGCVMGGVL